MSQTERIRIELLRTIYESAESHILAPFGRQELIDEAAENLDDADEDDVTFALTELEEERLVIRDGTTIELSARGISELSENGHDTELDDSTQIEILEELLEARRDNPNHPKVDLEQLSQDLGIDRAVIDDNIMILDSTGNVDLESINQTYVASITSRGRQTIE